MKFEMPKADRARLEQLLEYLGDTSRYSEYYDGNRAEDFKKCFDIESEWCWKYADLVLRGLEKRELEYAEGHHIVPASFYGKRQCSISDDGNLTALTYGEHLWAHYCLVFCATGKLRGKMASAFLIMYRIGMTGSRPLMPSESELFDAIPEMEMRRIRSLDPKWAKVEAEGRTHFYEDPKQYKKEYYEANREKLAERHKAYFEANKEKVAEQQKAYYEANKEKIAERQKAYREANKDNASEYNKAYREANKEKLAENKRNYREANKEKLAEQQKAYREANKEKASEYNKAYRETNKEKLAENKRNYYESNKEKVAEQHKDYYDAKKAAGYRRRKNPLTGKLEWIFVGLPEQEMAA